MMEMFDAVSGTDNEFTREHSVVDERPIYRRISPLKDLAGIAAAVTLLCPIFKKSTNWDELYTFKYERKNDIIYNLAIPLSIKNMLGRYVSYAIYKIIVWGEYYRRSSITYQTCAILLNNHLCEIVWESDGEIDYRKTALKMLSNPDLEEQDKFIIAASHCLENHMRKMWPLKSADKIESLLDEASSHALIAYWYHYFKGDTHELSYRNFWYGSRSMTHPIYTPHVATYFWKRLPIDEQECGAIDVIQRATGHVCQKYLLSEMNASQQLSIIKKMGVGKFIFNFTLFFIEGNFEYAVLTWEYIGNTINQEQYLYILTDILKQAEEDNILIENSRHIDFLDIMWKITPSSLKRYASDVEEGAVINLLTSYNREFHFGTQFAMLVSILPNIELCWRQNILHKILCMPIISLYSETIFERVIMETERPLLFDKFVKLCIPDSEERAEFKRNWISSEFLYHYCIQLMKNAKLVELDECITIFESNIMNIPEYKIHLLTNLISKDDFYFNKYGWRGTPSHEWKLFCSGIDEESLISVFSHFRSDTHHPMHFEVLVNILPIFEVDFRHIILNKMISSQDKSVNIFEKLIIWYDKALILHEFIKLCFPSTQKQFEFKKKWISENVLIQYCAFLICTVSLDKANEFLALYPPNASNNFEFMIRVLKSCYEIKNGRPLFDFSLEDDVCMEIRRLVRIFLWLRKQKYKMKNKNKRKIFFKIMDMNLRYNEGF